MDSDHEDITELKRSSKKRSMKVLNDDSNSESNSLKSSSESENDSDVDTASSNSRNVKRNVIQKPVSKLRIGKMDQKPSSLKATLNKPHISSQSGPPRKFVFGNRAPRPVSLSKPFVAASLENKCRNTPTPCSDTSGIVSESPSPSLSAHESLIKKALSKPFRVPTISGAMASFAGGASSLHLGMRRPGQKRALHDPYEEGALVLYSPAEISADEKMKLAPDKVEVHVVVDPVLSKILRPHQREGVKFMWECVTGVRIPNSYGCILADEMGLGKTLQVVTLLWTLLRQSPSGGPTVERACVVCPTALVKNWANEFDKWLGVGRCGALVLEGTLSSADIDKRLVQFGAQMGARRPTPVLIVSYDTFRLHVKVIANAAKLGIIVCDEGHRLKNADSLTYQALLSVGVQRRVLLSGTPIQNDLTEYFSLVHFVNEGMLGTAAEFRKKFELPILKSRDRDASDKERELGTERLKELLETVNKCLLRRTQALLTRYLPVKYELLVCCRMTETQKEVYLKLCADARRVIATETVSETAGPKSCAFVAITSLKKVTCHPSLAGVEMEDSDDENLDADDEKKKKAAKKKPAVEKPILDIKSLRVELSGKLAALDMLLAIIKSQTDDKVVLVSNYTQVMDIMESLCVMRQYSFIRLDGTMTAKSRGNAVAKFNDQPVAKGGAKKFSAAAAISGSTSSQSAFIFILSSKAGGCGLNLIGANRLVMFDPDWNPANDDQAMARCWRDGQKKECFVYRFVATGSIEEKIVQRQAHKRSLKTAVVDDKAGERHFSASELRDLFSFDEKTASDTHDRLRCKRCVNNCQAMPPKNDAETDFAAAMGDLAAWNHEHAPLPGNEKLAGRGLPDQILRQTWSALPGVISFVFHRKSHDKQIATA